MNDRYGVGLTEEDRISLENLERRLTDDTALQAAVKSNTRSNVELTFEQKVNDYLQDMADSNFKLYKRINDDRLFGAHLLSCCSRSSGGSAGWRGRGNVNDRRGAFAR